MRFRNSFHHRLANEVALRIEAVQRGEEEQVLAVADPHAHMSLGGIEPDAHGDTFAGIRPYCIVAGDVRFRMRLIRFIAVDDGPGSAAIFEMDAVASGIAVADDGGIGEIVEVNDARLGNLIRALDWHTALRLRLRSRRYLTGADQHAERDQDKHENRSDHRLCHLCLTERES
ncbi:MAG: hypothetical protein WHX53_11260 [Anaerolineae bacterium]